MENFFHFRPYAFDYLQLILTYGSKPFVITACRCKRNRF